MLRIDRLQDVDRIADVRVRQWVRQRWLSSDADLCVFILAPTDAPLETLWSVCMGSSAPVSFTVLTDLFEDVVDHATFYEVLILPNHDSALIAVVPKSAVQAAPWCDYLHQIARPVTYPSPSPA